MKISFIVVCMAAAANAVNLETQVQAKSECGGFFDWFSKPKPCPPVIPQTPVVVAPPAAPASPSDSGAAPVRGDADVRSPVGKKMLQEADKIADAIKKKAVADISAAKKAADSGKNKAAAKAKA